MNKNDVEHFLKDLKVKIQIFGIIFLDDRSKNQQALLDLEILPKQRKEIIQDLKVEDYSEGPLAEKMHGLLPMWVFGKIINKKEIYIKISMGEKNSQAICISFHVAEYPMNYPLKN